MQRYAQSLLAIVFLISASAQAEAGVWADWISENMARISSVKYTQTKSLVREHDNYHHFWSEKEILDVGEHYRFQYKKVDADNVQITDYHEALTSQHLQMFYPESGFLRLYKPAEKAHPLLRTESFLYSILEFLTPEQEPENLFNELRLDNLRKNAESMIGNQKNRTTHTGVQEFFGKSYNSFTAGAGAHPKYKIDSFYKVFYDPDSGEIVGWNMVVTHKGRDLVLASLVVTEPGFHADNSGKNIWYPKLFRKYFYGWNLDMISDKPTHYLEYSTVDIEFNCLNEYDVMIDPSLVRVIRDEVNDVNIFVPQ